MESLQEEKKKKVDDFYKAISDPVRRQILDLLRHGALSSGDIAKHFPSMARSNISQHLSFLKKCDLVRSVQKSLYVYYKLNYSVENRIKKEEKKLASIKENVLDKIRQIANEKKCESYLKEDSHDNGKFYISKNTTLYFSFRYAFHYSYFEIDVDFPFFELFSIPYDDQERIFNFLSLVKEKLAFRIAYGNKRDLDLKTVLLEDIYTHPNLFNSENEEILKKQITYFVNSHSDFVVNLKDKETLIEDVFLSLTSFGKLSSLYKDPSVSEIFVNHPSEVIAMKDGKMEKSEIFFEDVEELYQQINLIAFRANKFLNPVSPTLDFTWHDKSRITILSPPVTKDFPAIIIRKFNNKKINLNKLIEDETLSVSSARFLENAIQEGKSILISGKVGVGKTTLLNVFADLIPNNDRIVCIEDVHELTLNNSNSIFLSTHQSKLSSDEVILHSLNLSPSRIILSEMREDNEFRLISNFSNSYSIMTTLHGKDSNNALQRLVEAAYLSNHPIGDSIVNTFDLIVHMELKENKRIVTEISEISHYNFDSREIILKPIFKTNKKIEKYENSEADYIHFQEDFYYFALNFAEEYLKGNSIIDCCTSSLKSCPPLVKNELTFFISNLSQETLYDSALRFNNSDWLLFCFVLIIGNAGYFKFNNLLEKFLFILEERQRIIVCKTNQKLIDFSNYLDLLFFVLPYKSLIDAIEYTLPFCKNEEIKQDFLFFIDQYTKNPKYCFRDAVKFSNFEFFIVLMKKLHHATVFGTSVEDALLKESRNVRGIIAGLNEIE